VSARRSADAKLQKRAAAMVAGYQERMDRQRRVIDRLSAAVAVYGDLAYGVASDAKTIKDARKLASDAQAKVDAILAVPNEK
jgi:hypothetical protein